ncbi:jg7459 [Pararge aegeria aegeria]|uniref:Jg7459 protein n=1 Tax=Pararge aegeria aegeria TaxID=348720 RepID=A0A8S4RAW8_9NEOP|nr:jg7459 [Pararge aegeria aegeria]
MASGSVVSLPPADKPGKRMQYVKEMNIEKLDLEKKKKYNSFPESSNPERFSNYTGDIIVDKLTETDALFIP